MSKHRGKPLMTKTFVFNPFLMGLYCAGPSRSVYWRCDRTCAVYGIGGNRRSNDSSTYISANR